jgi:hypothetical protein
MGKGNCKITEDGMIGRSEFQGLPEITFSRSPILSFASRQTLIIQRS